MTTTWLCVSATEDEAAVLDTAGPRRDFRALAARVGATLVYRTDTPHRGWRGRLLGPHVRQAWDMARLARNGDRVFADGEHIAIPFLFFLAFRLRRPTVTAIGHMPGRWWKRVLLALCTRLGSSGTLLVHSRMQADLVGRWMGPGWRLVLVPYQVDTDFWTDDGRAQAPLIVAVGSEERDYETLVEAVHDLPASVLIAAGSLWARDVATARSAPPPNVAVLTSPLPYRQLLERYRDATLVVVPLKPAGNQAGVTTILEAMSVGRPVVVSATPGQSDVVVGPLVASDGTFDEAATASRGPGFGTRVSTGAWSGLYVRAGDAAGLRAALSRLLEDAELRQRLAGAARSSAVADFTFEAYVDALEAALMPASVPLARRSDVAT